MGFVTFKRRKIDVEVEATGVALRALDEGAEGAIEEAGGTPPPSPTAVIIGEGNGIGHGAVGAGLWSVVYGDLLDGMSLMV